MMDADPSHRLMKILGQLEDAEGLIHVLYQTSCYQSDCNNEKSIFEMGIAEGGDRPVIELLSKSLKKIHREIESIQSQLPKNQFFKCPTTTLST